MTQKPTFSFEFFPPKTSKSRIELAPVARELATLNPSFMTVTYGAGGSSRDWTMETAAAMQEDIGIPVAAHLTCVNTFKGDMKDIADRLWGNDIRHIVALRGDVPHEDMPLDYNDKDYYHYANELVAGLKSWHDFEISVAAYPEKHPEASDLDTDIEHLKRKCDAGATRAITQFFFENETFYRFLDKTQAAGITIPIVPGVLPIPNFEKMLGFAAMCQAKVPHWLHEKFRELEDKPAENLKVAEDVLAAQCHDLADHGVEHLHFYTLNKTDITMQACKACVLTV